MLLWKRKSHWTVTKIIFRNRELTGTNASKSKTGTQCCVSPCTAQLPSCWLCTHLCFSSAAILPVLEHHVLCVLPVSAGSCCNRHCFFMSCSALVLEKHKAVIWGNREHFSVLKSSKQTTPPSPFGFHVEWCQRFGAKGQSGLACFIKGKNYFPLFPPYFEKTVLGWLLVPRDVFNCSLCFSVFMETVDGYQC